jgi:hypothetical protein
MRKILKYGTIALLVLIIAGIIYVAIAVHVIPPEPKDLSSLKLQRRELDGTCYTIGNNWIRKSKTGLWEMYVEGKPFERGVINGKLAKELVQKQEEAFTDQIAKMIPSRFYRNFLKYFIGVFNSHHEQNINEE